MWDDNVERMGPCQAVRIWVRTRRGATRPFVDVQSVLCLNAASQRTRFADLVAQLGKARATKDKAEYEKFLELWKDADKDMPALTAAREELEAL